MHWWLPPLVGALVGYWTNWLAIRMLFRPRNPVYILGRRVPMTPGLFVARRREFARQLAQAFVVRFVNKKDLAAALAQASKGGLFTSLSGQMAPGVRAVMTKAMSNMSPEDIGKICSSLSDTVRTSGMVEDLAVEKVSSMSADEIESMILDVVEKEFGAITVVGGILGLAIGSVQSILALL